MPLYGARDFTWRDGPRTVLFRRGAVAQAAEILRDAGWQDFALLSTVRAAPEGRRLRKAAAEVHEVERGKIPPVAARLVSEVEADKLVALGGGRVIDVAKAIASVRGGQVCAIPTTLSGAEMTGIHRLPTGLEVKARGPVRPVLVLADPALMTSAPEARLRASAMNALGHGAEALYTPLANPVSTMAALHGAELIAAALEGEREAAGLALGAMLCAYAIDSALFAIHHVVCQTLVQICDTPHAETNAAMLPFTLMAVQPHAPDEIAALAQALGATPEEISERVTELTGQRYRLRDLGARRDQLEAVAEAAGARPDLASTPGGAPSEAALLALLEVAW
jgi:alcohol dehydrogenase class IV